MNGNTKWILSLIALFIFIATAMGGYAIGEVDEVKRALASDYVMKDDFRCAVNRVDNGITRLNDKMDEMLLEIK